MESGRKTLVLNRETVRSLSDLELNRVAGANHPHYSQAVRAYSYQGEYTCQCDTVLEHGCEGITSNCNTTIL